MCKTCLIQVGITAVCGQVFDEVAECDARALIEAGKAEEIKALGRIDVPVIEAREPVVEQRDPVHAKKRKRIPLVSENQKKFYRDKMYED